MIELKPVDIAVEENVLLKLSRVAWIDWKKLKLKLKLKLRMDQGLRLGETAKMKVILTIHQLERKKLDLVKMKLNWNSSSI